MTILGERMAAVRAANPGLLVSHVDDKRNVVIGHYVQEAAPDESDYEPRAGTVVERWHTEDGEAGVTAVDFTYRGREVQVIVRRFLTAHLRQELLPSPDPYHCALTARTLCQAVGQGIKRNGRADRLSDTEAQYLFWAEALYRSTP